MKCTDFELRLQELFDERGTLDGDAELQAHALTCAECQALVESYELLFDGVLARAARHEYVADDRKVELAATDRHAGAHGRRRVAWVAAAAMLLAVGLTARTWWRSTEPGPAENNFVAVPVQETVLPAASPVIVSPAVNTVTPAIAAPTSAALASTTVDSAPMTVEEVEATGLSFLESPADEYAGLYRATGRSLAMMVRSIPTLHGETRRTEPLRSESGTRSWKQLHSSIEPLSASVTEALQELFRGGKPAVTSPATTDRAS